MARIAFIGLGNMGGGMAANLAKAGHDVRAFDLSEDALARAEGARLPAAPPRPPRRCEDAEAVVTMLPAGKHVRDVYEASVIGKAPDERDPDRLLDHRRRHRPRGDREGRAPPAMQMVDAPGLGRHRRGRGAARSPSWSAAPTRRSSAPSPSSRSWARR